MSARLPNLDDYDNDLMPGKAGYEEDDEADQLEFIRDRMEDETL